MFSIVPSCNLVQYQRKLMMQPCENGKNHNFGSNLGDPKPFSWVLPLLVLDHVPSYHPMQFKGKLMNHTWENAKNLFWGLILAQIWSLNFFLLVLPLVDVIHCCKLSLYAISRKTKEPNLRKWQKTQFQAQFYPLSP